ncbi:MAG: hypothetical protein R3C03_00795 [Pirellulaceae bacterium]
MAQNNFSTQDLVAVAQGGELPLTLLKIGQQADLKRAELSIEHLLEKAWTTPVDYPSITESIFAGDVVALVVDSEEQVVHELAKQLAVRLRASTECEVHIVVTERDGKQFWTESLGDIEITRHNPDDDQAMAMLAIDGRDQPIYINRVLFDADVAIPVTEKISGPPSAEDCVVPNFLGTENQAFFRDASNAERRAEIRLVNQHLGTFMQFQVSVGVGGKLSQLWFGEREAVEGLAERENRAAWQVNLSTSSPIVIGTIEGTSSAQNWSEIVKAIRTLDQIAAPNAPIVISCSIDQLPSKAIRRALSRESSSSKGTSQELNELSEIAASHPLFLHSGLSAADTESLGFGNVNQLGELKRLLERFGPGTMLRDAHRCQFEGVE